MKSFSHSTHFRELPFDHSLNVALKSTLNNQRTIFRSLLNRSACEIKAFIISQLASPTFVWQMNTLTRIFSLVLVHKFTSRAVFQEKLCNDSRKVIQIGIIAFTKRSAIQAIDWLECLC